MDPPFILPKGVIKNSAGITGSIGRMNTEPLDLADIARFWKVYTTTRRRLLDPTAERLENYWWRIWGSRARELEASTVARIFAYISDGNSFVPLRGPANRDEGTPPILTKVGLGTSSTTAIHRPGTSKHSSTPKISVIPPPSILKGSDSKKKSRGPSGSGPRPTARFISPHESENENSPISPNSHVVVQPPSPTVREPNTEKKSVASSGKKRAVFVASSGRGKRPSAMRRQSSQSSTDSPAKGGEVLQSSSDRTPPKFVEQAQERAKQRVQPPSQENSTSSSRKSDRKRGSSKLRASDTKDTSSQKPVLKNRKSSKEVTSEIVDDAQPGPSSKLRLIENSQDRPAELTPEEMEEIEMQRLLLAEANARVQTQAVLPLAQKEALQPHRTSARKVSNGTLDPAGAGKLAQTRNKSAPSLAHTFADANGQLDMSNGTQPSRKKDKGKGRDPDDIPQDDMFSKRPVQPVTSTSVPDFTGGLSRSKSQLTLLLEKDRAKSIDHSSNDKKGKRRQ